jgi:hypothetical protein
MCDVWFVVILLSFGVALGGQELPAWGVQQVDSLTHVGYPFAHAIWVKNSDASEVITIEKGEQYLLGAVVWPEHRISKEWYLQKKWQKQPWQPFSAGSLDSAYKRLASYARLVGEVTIQLKQDSMRRVLTPVVQFTEQRLSYLQVEGALVNNKTQGAIQVYLDHLGGVGRTLYLDGHQWEETRWIALEYINPYLWQTQWDYGVSGYLWQPDQSRFRQELFTFIAYEKQGRWSFGGGRGRMQQASSAGVFSRITLEWEKHLRRQHLQMRAGVYDLRVKTQNTPPPTKSIALEGVFQDSMAIPLLESLLWMNMGHGSSFLPKMPSGWLDVPIDLLGEGSGAIWATHFYKWRTGLVYQIGARSSFFAVMETYSVEGGSFSMPARGIGLTYIQKAMLLEWMLEWGRMNLVRVRWNYRL